MKYPDHVRGDNSERVDVGDDTLLLPKDVAATVVLVLASVVVIDVRWHDSTFRRVSICLHEEEDGAPPWVSSSFLLLLLGVCRWRL